MRVEEVRAVIDLWRSRANTERDRDGNRYAQERAERFDLVADSFEKQLEAAMKAEGDK